MDGLEQGLAEALGSIFPYSSLYLKGNGVLGLGMSAFLHFLHNNPGVLNPKWKRKYEEVAQGQKNRVRCYTPPSMKLPFDQP